MSKIFLALVISGLVSGGAAFAGKKGGKGEKGRPEPTTEHRAKLAEAHEKMATCLRSETPVGDCHKALKDARKAMGKDMKGPHGEHGSHGDSGGADEGGDE